MASYFSFINNPTFAWTFLCVRRCSSSLNFKNLHYYSYQASFAKNSISLSSYFFKIIFPELSKRIIFPTTAFLDYTKTHHDQNPFSSGDKCHAQNKSSSVLSEIETREIAKPSLARRIQSWGKRNIAPKDDDQLNELR